MEDTDEFEDDLAPVLSGYKPYDYVGNLIKAGWDLEAGMVDFVVAKKVDGEDRYEPYSFREFYMHQDELPPSFVPCILVYAPEDMVVAP